MFPFTELGRVTRKWRTVSAWRIFRVSCARGSCAAPPWARDGATPVKGVPRGSTASLVTWKLTKASALVSVDIIRGRMGKILNFYSIDQTSTSARRYRVYARVENASTLRVHSPASVPTAKPGIRKPTPARTKTSARRKEFARTADA